MTPHLFLAILVSLYLAAGVVITATSGKRRARPRRPALPRSHVHEVKVPYDWEEHDAS